jgi:hypothetical protein
MNPGSYNKLQKPTSHWLLQSVMATKNAGKAAAKSGANLLQGVGFKVDRSAAPAENGAMIHTTSARNMRTRG